MAIALRHEYNYKSNTANEVDMVSYPDALRQKIELAKKTAAAAPSVDNKASQTESITLQKGFLGEVKPIWVGNPDAPSRRVSFQPLQEWEGYVVNIEADHFTARLVDLTAGQTVEEEVAEFPMADLAESDRKLLRPGAVFRWVIGYRRSIGGTKGRVSQLVFRRMPAWQRRDLENAERRAESLINDIDWE